MKGAPGATRGRKGATMAGAPQASDTTQEHEWRPVPGYEHLFKVTRDGRVFSMRTRRELKTLIGPTGYRQFATRIGGRKGAARLFKPHILVALAWIGPAPSDKHEVHHRDGDKLNNDVSNLEWVTRSENTKHAIETGLLEVPRGERRHGAKLTDAAVRRIRRVCRPHHRKLGVRALAREYGVCHRTVLDALHGRLWAHVEEA